MFLHVFWRCHDSSKMMKRGTPAFFSRFWAVSLNFENGVTKRQKWRSVTPPPQKIKLVEGPGPRRRQEVVPQAAVPSQSSFRVQAQANHTPRPFSWGLNPVTLTGELPQLRAVPPEPPASAELRPAGPGHRGRLDSPSPYE